MRFPCLFVLLLSHSIELFIRTRPYRQTVALLPNYPIEGFRYVYLIYIFLAAFQTVLIQKKVKLTILKELPMKLLPKLKISGFFLLGLLFTLFTLTTQINANTDLTQLPFYWDTIDVELDVRDNGDMLVTETQKYVFNREHPNERYRYIPLNKVDKITDVTVSENNQIIPSQVGKKNNQLWIKWKHELNPPESHTFVIKYRVVGGLPINSHRAQVYWKAIFSDRQSPIQNASVTVRLPKSLAGKIYYYNYYADRIPVSSQKLDGQTIKFVAQKPIPEGQDLEIQVAFPNSVLNLPQPKWQQSSVSQGTRSRSSSNNDSRKGVINFSVWTIILLLVVALLLSSFASPSSGSSNSRSNSRRSSRASGGG